MVRNKRKADKARMSKERKTTRQHIREGKTMTTIDQNVRCMKCYGDIDVTNPESFVTTFRIRNHVAYLYHVNCVTKLEEEMTNNLPKITRCGWCLEEDWTYNMNKVHYFNQLHDNELAVDLYLHEKCENHIMERTQYHNDNYRSKFRDADENETREYCELCSSWIEDGEPTGTYQEFWKAPYIRDEIGHKACVDKFHADWQADEDAHNTMAWIKPEDWEMSEEELPWNGGIIKSFRTTDLFNKGSIDDLGGCYTALEYRIAEAYRDMPVMKDDPRWFGRPIVAVKITADKILDLRDPLMIIMTQYLSCPNDSNTWEYNAAIDLVRNCVANFRTGLVQEWIKMHKFDCAISPGGIYGNTPYITGFNSDKIEYVGICKGREKHNYNTIPNYDYDD